MKKNSSVLIAVLTLTAILLGVILLSLPQRTVQASMIANEPGVTVLTCGRTDGVGGEYVVVIDKAANRLIVYGSNTTGGLDVVGGLEYPKVFVPAKRTGPGPAPVR